MDFLPDDLRDRECAMRLVELVEQFVIARVDVDGHRERDPNAASLFAGLILKGLVSALALSGVPHSRN
jgi:hypothetical protein